MTTPPALTEFASEAQEIVDALARDLLQLGTGSAGEPDPELVNRVFRSAHSLKGVSGMFGAAPLATLAHAAEDLLDDVRMGRLQLHPDVLDLLLEAVDLFHRMLAELGKPEGAAGEAGRKLAARIAERRTAPSTSADADPLDAAGLHSSVRAVLTEYEEHRLRENLRRGVTLLKVRADFSLADFDKGLAELNARLKPLGEVVSTLPSSDPGRADGIAFDLLFGTSTDIDQVRASLSGLPAKVSAMGGRARSVHPVEPDPSVAAPERRREDPSREAEASLRSVTQTVRVDIGRLDRLMNTVGELVQARAGLQRVADQLRQGALDQQEASLELQRGTRLLERKLDELQKGILEVRMVPLEQVFEKLARMVRKVSREAGKEIEFLVEGGDVELDKLIVEELSDPLMHIIRNAIDHGIEAPEAREAAGKPRRGQVRLAARQKGNRVLIEVSDDGAGVDEESVRRAAVERGLTTAQAAKDLPRRDVLNLLFLPGFSTAKKVSQLSGRGVGLDVVKTNIANLSGIIDVQSARGEGTRFSVTLPVTLAIIRALAVGVAGRTYAVPLNAVLEILEVRRRDVRMIEGREVVDVRGSTLPLVRLARLFRLGGDETSASFYVVVVGLAQERLGIAVDELSAQQDVVIKPLGKLLAGVPGIAGATDLGDRRTVLVLDVGAIIDEVMAGERALRDAGI